MQKTHANDFIGRKDDPSSETVRTARKGVEERERESNIQVSVITSAYATSSASCDTRKRPKLP